MPYPFGGGFMPPGAPQTPNLPFASGLPPKAQVPTAPDAPLTPTGGAFGQRPAVFPGQGQMPFQGLPFQGGFPGQGQMPWTTFPGQGQMPFTGQPFMGFRGGGLGLGGLFPGGYRFGG